MISKLFKFSILFITLCTIRFNAMAQQDGMNSQYFFHKMYINPGYAGTIDEIQSTLTRRDQWVNIPGSPKTTSIMVHGPMGEYNFGVGGIFILDQLGPESKSSFLLNVSYQIHINYKVKLSLGIQAGLISDNIRWEDIEVKDKYDPLVYEQENSSRYSPDFNVGIYLYGLSWYAGVSARHLTQSEYAYSEGTVYKSAYSLLSRHIYLFSGVIFPLTRDHSIYMKPSFMLKYLQSTGIQYDVTTNFLFMNRFWLGATYRNTKSIIAMTAFNITPSITLGYSYDIDLGKTLKFGSNSHEVMISYSLKDKKRIINPRQF
ncbi:type IX secretion system membrane protein PorP/SprF [Halosquirtibacter xylanolyticus]|uniref:PorP/SprF family type IX secretion system membrane protein n=1 Tax=Halosquirtibacter xylanolyticus TaxID=3374599 RepID=UPI0037487451|nr:type IX secretion system membrane protein PorP/SprF [Prolixibacteraceae bacterium]